MVFCSAVSETGFFNMAAGWSSSMRFTASELVSMQRTFRCRQCGFDRAVLVDGRLSCVACGKQAQVAVAETGEASRAEAHTQVTSARMPVVESGP